MTTDVDTLESQVSEQLADLVQSLGNLKEQAEAHGSSSKTLSDTAAELRQLIPAITATTAAIQSSAAAVSKVDTSAVLQELQETRSNLQTALTTAAQRNDTFQSEQDATGKKVTAAIDALLETATGNKQGITTAADSIKRLDQKSERLSKGIEDGIAQLFQRQTTRLDSLETNAKSLESRQAEQLSAIEARIGKTRTLVLAFGAVTVIGVLAILGAILLLP